MDHHTARRHAKGRESVNDGAKLFVNYRRRDAPGSAGRLHDDLARRFGAAVAAAHARSLAPVERRVALPV